MTHNPVKGVKRPRAETGQGKTPALGDHQARELLAAPNKETVKSKRDRAVLSTLLYHALRRDELCKLKVKDFRNMRRGVPHLNVSGKGDKTRYLPLHPGTNVLTPSPPPRASAAAARHRSCSAPSSIPPPTAHQKAGETDIFKLDGTDICTLRLHQMCPPNTDVTNSAIYRCHWGRAAGGREALGVAQRPTGARGMDARRRTDCFTGRAEPARLVERLSRL